MGENAGTLVSVAVLAALCWPSSASSPATACRARRGGAGVAIWALLTVIFLCELSFGRMSLSGVAGVLTGLSLTAGGFALLLERCLRETRSLRARRRHAPRLASALPAMTDAGVAVLLAGLAMYSSARAR